MKINTTAPDFSPVLPPSEWNPHEGSSYIWGDGKLLYFGVDGPISSMRAENLRDAMEDIIAVMDAEGRVDNSDDVRWEDQVIAAQRRVRETKID